MANLKNNDIDYSKKTIKNFKPIVHGMNHEMIPLYIAAHSPTRRYLKKDKSFEGKKRIDAALGLIKLKHNVKRHIYYSSDYYIIQNNQILKKKRKF